jgi:hypothetical protein
MGNNRFDFDRSPLNLINPTKSYFDYKDTLKYTSLYRDDHSSQSVIIDSRVNPISHEEYSRNNPVHYDGSLCPICGEMSLDDDGYCALCDYNSDDFGMCPKCRLQTFEGGECQNRDCDFEYDVCDACSEKEYDPDSEICNNCSYNPNGCDECPKCGRDMLKDGECLSYQCNYNTDDYIECPNCDEDTYDEDNNECIKCGHVIDEDDDEDEEEEEDSDIALLEED